MSGPHVEQLVSLAPHEVRILLDAYRAHRCSCGADGCRVGHSALNRLLAAGVNPTTAARPAEDGDGFALGPSES